MATHFPVFVDGSTGSRALKAHANWNYNPGTETLSAGKIATDVAAIVEDNKSNSALMTLTGQGAGNESNISLKMLGTSNGNPIKMKMVGLDEQVLQYKMLLTLIVMQLFYGLLLLIRLLFHMLLTPM